MLVLLLLILLLLILLLLLLVLLLLLLLLLLLVLLLLILLLLFLLLFELFLHLLELIHQIPGQFRIGTSVFVVVSGSDRRAIVIQRAAQGLLGDLELIDRLLCVLSISLLQGFQNLVVGDIPQVVDGIRKQTGIVAEFDGLGEVAGGGRPVSEAIVGDGAVVHQFGGGGFEFGLGGIDRLDRICVATFRDRGLAGTDERPIGALARKRCRRERRYGVEDAGWNQRDHWIATSISAGFGRRLVMNPSTSRSSSAMAANH